MDCGWHVCPPGALEVFTSGGGAALLWPALKKACEREEDCTWAWGGTEGGGVTGLTQAREGGGGEEGDIGVQNELLKVRH